MKLFPNPTRLPRKNRGSTVLVVCVLLAIMVILVTVNISAVRSLGREMKALDQHQQQRWQPRPAGTTKLSPEGPVGGKN